MNPGVRVRCGCAWVDNSYAGRDRCRLFLHIGRGMEVASPRWWVGAYPHGQEGGVPALVASRYDAPKTRQGRKDETEVANRL